MVNKMRVGFDIDGVILDIDLAVIRLIDFLPDKKLRKEASKFYYALRRPLLNPLDFLHEDDELFIITGRPIEYKEITEKWAKKYFPKAELIILGSEKFGDTDVEVPDIWYVKHAKRKAKAINDNKIEVYFEDTAPIVKELRKLCPNTKIIQYGGRFGL